MEQDFLPETVSTSFPSFIEIFCHLPRVLQMRCKDFRSPSRRLKTYVMLFSSHPLKTPRGLTSCPVTVFLPLKACGRIRGLEYVTREEGSSSCRTRLSITWILWTELLLKTTFLPIKTFLGFESLRQELMSTSLTWIQSRLESLMLEDKGLREGSGYIALTLSLPSFS